MPPLRADLTTDCEDPGLRVGQDVHSALARNRTWAKCERSKHRATVKVYNDVRGARPR